MSDYVTPNGSDVAVSETEDRNKAIERAELDAWKTQPIGAIGYYTFPEERAGQWRRSFTPWRNGAVVTTWLGTIIGRIVSARVHTNNFGARIVTMTVVGTNGARYSGRASWDSGNVIQLRRMKG